MTVKSEDDLDDVRRLILKRAREINFTLADLSRACGKNMSYVHQFIHRGSPIRLPEDVRETLAATLRLPDTALRPGAGSPREIIPLPHAVAPQYPQFPPSQPDTGHTAPVRDVPVYDDEIDLSQVKEWAPRPHSLLNSDKLFAMWVRLDRGRLRAGDLVYFQTTQPPRVGDTVVVLAGNKVVDMGDLTGLDERGATVGAKPPTKSGGYPIPEHRIMRAAFILCA